jgi:hypothetical protein
MYGWIDGWMDGWEVGTYYGVSPADLGETSSGYPKKKKEKRWRAPTAPPNAATRTHTHKQCGRENEEEELHSFQWWVFADFPGGGGSLVPRKLKNFVADFLQWGREGVSEGEHMIKLTQSDWSILEDAGSLDHSSSNTFCMGHWILCCP